MWLVVNDFRKHAMLSNLTISDVYRCFPCKLYKCLWKTAKEMNAMKSSNLRHTVSSMVSNQQEKGFLNMHHYAFCDPVEAFTKTSVLLEWWTVAFRSIFIFPQLHIFKAHSLSFQWRLLSNRVCP